MAQEDHTQVVIYGRGYRLSGGDPARTRELARKVDHTMRRLSERLPGSGEYQLAILSALHLADELARAEEELASLQDKVSDSADRLLERLESALAKAR